MRTIFVFGSNLAGRHSRGSALEAFKYWGAIYGQGAGLQGESYAIPTKDHALNMLSLDKIQKHVNTFIKFAGIMSLKEPNTLFKVVEIGCGLAGYSPEDIGPLFAKAEYFKNVELPLSFLRAIDANKYADGRAPKERKK